MEKEAAHVLPRHRVWVALGGLAGELEKGLFPLCVGARPKVVHTMMPL